MRPIDFTDRPKILSAEDAAVALRAAIDSSCDGKLPDDYGHRVFLMCGAIAKLTCLVLEHGRTLTDEQNMEIEWVCNMAASSLRKLSVDEFTYSPQASSN